MGTDNIWHHKRIKTAPENYNNITYQLVWTEYIQLLTDSVSVDAKWSKNILYFPILFLVYLLLKSFGLFAVTDSTNKQRKKLWKRNTNMLSSMQIINLYSYGFSFYERNESGNKYI